jgi:flagellar hook-associated protein 3 FlgL
MRITSRMMKNDFLNNLNTNLTILTKSQKQIATGKVLNSLSDDPIRLISSMNCKVKLGRTVRYKSSVSSALEWLDQTESSVSELNDILKSAYETAVKMSNDDLTLDDKNAAAELIAQLRDHVLGLGNSQVGDRYIFGGYNVNKPPFTADGTGGINYNGIDLTDETNASLINEGKEKIQIELGYNVSMDISINGTELLGTGDGNIYSMLNDFYNALRSDSDASVLSGYITKIQDAQSKTLSTLSKVGGMINRMELLENRYEEERLTYIEQKSNIEDVDYAEAYMNYNMAKAVYEAALQVGTEITQRTILDYMR